MSASLGAIGGVVGSIGALGAGFIGGPQASKALQNANNQLLQNAQQMYATDQANLKPYMTTGAGYSNALLQQLPQLEQGFNPTQAQLEASPGYQFELQQGLEAAQNGFAARGLGVSGAAMKGAANYAQGLASNDYTNLANVYNTNRMDTANILTSGSNLGLQAAGTLGQLGMNDLQYQQAALQGIGNAKAQGDLAPWQGISAAGSDIAGASGTGSGGGSSILSML